MILQILLKTLGFIADKWIGTSGFKIDIAVVDPTNPGQYILGIDVIGGSSRATVVTRDREPIVLKSSKDWVGNIIIYGHPNGIIIAIKSSKRSLKSFKIM